MAEVSKGSKPVSMCTSKQPTSHISCLLKSMPAPFIRATSSSGDMLDMAAFTPKGKASTSGQPAQNARAQCIACTGINSNADNQNCASHISIAGLSRRLLYVESQLQPRGPSGVSFHHLALLLRTCSLLYVALSVTRYLYLSRGRPHWSHPPSSRVMPRTQLTTGR